MEKLKEKHPNINKRVSLETKEKIEELMQRDNLKANELFMEMITLYETNKNDLGNLPNFDNDLKELSNALCYISSIFSNITNKTTLHLQDVNNAYEEERRLSKLNIEEDFKTQAELLIKEKNQAIKEYELISKRAEELIIETRELKEQHNSLTSEIKKYTNLNESYLEQINSLKERNQMLEEKVKSSTSTHDLEAIKKEHSMAILELTVKYQNELNSIKDKHFVEVNSLRDKLNEEKDKYDTLKNEFLELKYKK